MSDDAYAVGSFEAFWPHYVALHLRRETQRWHAAATLTCGALAVTGLACRAPWLVLIAPLADHVVAQASHRRFEHNRTTPWRHPAWHARAELRMLRHVLAGTMQDEVRRVAASR